MDHFISVLTAFTPKNLEYSDNELYHKAVRLHVQKVEKLFKENANAAAGFADLLFQRVNPSVHSISYLYLLSSALSRYDKAHPNESGLALISTFLLTFDARQIRYAGSAFSNLLTKVMDADILPASVSVDLVATALLRLDPTGSMLTSHHLRLVQIAYETDNIEPVLPVIEKSIVFYPGMIRDPKSDTRFPCDLTLSPPEYITVESGLTQKLIGSAAPLQYDMLCGLCFIQRRSWQQAFDALGRVVSYPTREGGCSKIMAEAYNKWVLVGLLLNGKMPAMPALAGVGAQKAYGTLGKPYTTIAKCFENDTSVGPLKAEFDSIETGFWTEDGNLGLIRLVMAGYQRWQIARLRDVYTKISLEQIRQSTESAETGGRLETVAEVEKLVQGMIDDGMIRANIHRPSGGQPYLEFLSGSETGDLSEVEVEFSHRMVEVAGRIRALAPMVKATNERLSMNKDYLKHSIKEQKREKEGGGGGSGGSGGPGGVFIGGGGDRRNLLSEFETQIEDEDLMTGLVPSSAGN